MDLFSYMLGKGSGGSGGLDWAQLGYSAQPEFIERGYNEALTLKENWDSSQTNMYQKYKDNKTMLLFPSVDLSNVTSCSQMFYNCINLKQAEVYFEKATSFDNMFYSCSTLEYAKVGNSSTLTNMNTMFSNCPNLKTVDFTGLSSASVTNVSSMFNGCDNIETAPSFDTSGVTNMQTMFAGCGKLKNVPAYNTASVTNFTLMFMSCSSLTDESLNNIMKMCIDATSYSGTKTLGQLGLTSAQSNRCEALSNYQDFVSAGWTK